MGQAARDGSVNHTSLAIVNGAQGGKSASFWDSPADPDYDRVRDTRLAPQGLSEQQVQAVWVKVANPQPTVSLPTGGADAYTLVRQMSDIVRALKTRYPNLQQVFVSSRIYAGYATTDLNPEPYAYASGFSVKWLIEAQIRQMSAAGVDSRAGDLAYARAPWLGWGPVPVGGRHEPPLGRPRLGARGPRERRNPSVALGADEGGLSAAGLPSSSPRRRAAGSWPERPALSRS
jgi:hypothetical protein